MRGFVDEQAPGLFEQKETLAGQKALGDERLVFGGEVDDRQIRVGLAQAKAAASRDEDELARAKPGRQIAERVEFLVRVVRVAVREGDDGDDVAPGGLG